MSFKTVAAVAAALCASMATASSGARLISCSGFRVGGQLAVDLTYDSVDPNFVSFICGAWSDAVSQASCGVAELRCASPLDGGAMVTGTMLFNNQDSTDFQCLQQAFDTAIQGAVSSTDVGGNCQIQDAITTCPPAQKRSLLDGEPVSAVQHTPKRSMMQSQARLARGTFFQGAANTLFTVANIVFSGSVPGPPIDDVIEALLETMANTVSNDVSNTIHALTPVQVLDSGLKLAARVDTGLSGSNVVASISPDQWTSMFKATYLALAAQGSVGEGVVVTFTQEGGQSNLAKVAAVSIRFIFQR